jgi:L-aspartate oxidase
MLQRIPRYLVNFDPRNCIHRFTDVLIIGGGLAGLRAANEILPHQSVLVVTKDQLRQSNSAYAQGGIAGVLDPQDRFEDHIDDTLTAGGNLCDREIVEMVVREAPGRIQELVEWGTRFDQQAGSFSLGREGGHSHKRVVHALGDATGREVMRAVIEWTRGLENIEILENTFTLDLLTSSGTCRGAIIASGTQRTMIWAKQTILCTGGAGQLYRESTNPAVATADGYAIAYRAGAELRDMEFMQFHPTVLYIAGSSRSLITEAVRGEGAFLVDENNVRFMPDYDERAELAPRDIVCQAIVEQMSSTRHPCVYLDMSHLDADFIRSRFPGIAAACKKFSVDITSDKIPVRPGAHYMIGGVSVDPCGRTTLPGLWAAGEVTSSGLHGANRLASNSLLEGLVYGAHAGQGASQAAAEMPDRLQAFEIDNPPLTRPAVRMDLEDIRNSLKSLMWRCVGVQREESRLKQAISSIQRWQNYVLPCEFTDKTGWELQNMLTVSEIVSAAALQREESRGVHQRIDFPVVDDKNWQRHIPQLRPADLPQGDNQPV